MSAEVRPGYKQTEVGAIPDDWEVKPIRAVCKLINGRGFKPFEWEKTGLPIIRIQNLNGSDDFNFYQGGYDKKLEVDAGQLLFAWSGSRGTSFGPYVWKGPRGLLNYHTWKVQIQENEVTKEFFLHALKQLTTFIESKAHGASALVHTQKWEMEGFEFPLPPTKAEQEAIAEALSDADALIESLEQLVAKKRHLKQGAMQELLTGKKRLPGFTGEWEAKRLGDVIEQFVGGGTPSRSNPAYWGEEIPWVTVKDFATFNPHNSQEAITRTGLHNSASHLIPRGTLITSTRMALGKAVVYEVDVAINQDLKALSPKSILDTRYLYFWFQYHGQSIDELGSGSTVKGISLPDLKKIEFQLPSVSEQTAIAAVLADMDSELAELETQLAKTRTLKQGMMHKLLTGEIRLI